MSWVKYLVIDLSSTSSWGQLLSLSVIAGVVPCTESVVFSSEAIVVNKVLCVVVSSPWERSCEGFEFHWDVIK